MGNTSRLGAIGKASQAVSGVAAVFVVAYGFERVWVTAFHAGLPLWGVRTVVLAFVTAVILCAMLVLAPAVQVLLERLAALRSSHADESSPGS
jgi:prolipoprotein diacylglyceryltransferase